MQGVVLCAGSGIRLRPITDEIPKCMVEVKGVPLMERVLTHLINAGIDELNLVVGYKRQIIEDHFGPEFKGVKLNYFVQKEPRGTGHAVSLVHEYIKDQFLIANADVLASKNDYRELTRIGSFEEFDGLILARKVDDPWRYGALKTEREQIVDIIEKPNPGKEPSRMVNAGIYRFKKDFFEAVIETELSPRGEYEIVDSVKNYIAMGKKVEYRICQDTCIDISSMEDVKEANSMPNEKFPRED